MEKITLKDFSPDNIPIQKQIELLAQFMIENFENEIGNNGAGNGEGAIEMAVRLLLEYKKIIEKRCLHKFVFSHLETMANPSTAANYCEKTDVLVCELCGEVRRMII